jgi:hypothetical protein
MHNPHLLLLLMCAVERIRHFACLIARHMQQLSCGAITGVSCLGLDLKAAAAAGQQQIRRLSESTSWNGSGLLALSFSGAKIGYRVCWLCWLQACWVAAEAAAAAAGQ